MNKRLSLLILLFVLGVFGCTRGADRKLAIDAFKVSADCPNVCWLGITPGVTLADDAITILTSSDEILQESFFKISDSGIQTVWKIDDRSGNYTSDVWLSIEGSTVKSIGFGSVAPFTVGGFVSLLGEPDKIIIKLEETIHGSNLVMYAVFFSQYKASIFVYPGDSNGPNPDDYVEGLVLNADFTYPRYLDGNMQQDWLGYGHLQEYLPGQELP